MIRLHQILSLKDLGFSLKNIKNKMMTLDIPAEVANVFTEQATDIQRKIQNLSKAYEKIEMLKSEVLQMQSINFKKYADIILNIQMKNEYYWLIKHFDADLLDDIRKRFDTKTSEIFITNFNILNEKILKLQKSNVPPDSEKAQALAKDFFERVMEFTQGDMTMLPTLIKIKMKAQIQRHGLKSNLLSSTI